MRNWYRKFRNAFIPEFPNPQILEFVLCGSSSVGRATAFQAVGRGFEPRLPLLATIALAKVARSKVVKGIGGRLC